MVHNYQAMIKVLPGLSVYTPKTQKEARGRAKKWTLQHLPPSTASIFNEIVIPAARQKAGTLEPWTNPSTKDVQALVNAVYGEKTYTVTLDGVWYHLVQYRLTGWHNGFASAATDAVKQMITQYKDDLSTPAAIVDWVEQMLSKVSINANEKVVAISPFQWREWTSSEKKKGFFQSWPIIFVLGTAHLSTIDNSVSFSVKNAPIAAMVYAMQAVGRALSFWKSGVYEPPKSSSQFFSLDNFGDKYHKEIKTKDGKPIRVRKQERHATRFVKTLKSFNDETWSVVFERAQEFVVTKRKGGLRSSSVMRDDVQPDSNDSDDGDAIMESDASSADDNGAPGDNDNGPLADSVD